MFSTIIDISDIELSFKGHIITKHKFNMTERTYFFVYMYVYFS